MEEEVVGGESGKGSKIKDGLFIGISLIAVASVVFLSIGFPYSFGYSTSVGLLSGERNSEELLIFMGFVMFLELAKDFWSILIGPFKTWQFYLGLGSFMALLINLHVKKKDKVLSVVEDFSNSKALSIVFWGTLSFMVIIYFPLSSFERGKTSGKEEIQNLLSNGCTPKNDGWNRCHQIYEGDVLVHEGYLITKSGTDAIMFKREESALEYIKLSSEAVLKRQYQPPSSD